MVAELAGEAWLTDGRSDAESDEDFFEYFLVRVSCK
jgi:hypothetical protein